MSLTDVVCSCCHPLRLLFDATNGKTEVHCENKNYFCCFEHIRTVLMCTLSDTDGEISVSI